MATKWNSNVMFPTDSCFVNRIVGAGFAPSKGKGNPCITVDCELVSPQTYEVGDETIILAAIKTTNYFATQVLNDDKTVNEETTAKCQENVKELWRKLELNPDEINWDNIDVSVLRGKLILTMMSPDIEPRRKNPTSAQLAEAKKTGRRAEGDILKNPVTGKALIQYWPKIREIFGIAPSDGVNVPY